MKPSGIAVLRVSLCASNKYNLFCLFILYQALITKSLNSFSVNHDVTYCSTPPAPYIPCVYNDVHFELELSGQLTDAGCPEKGWCAPPHQQKDQSVIYYP